MAARLDALSARERSVLEDAAVGGRTGRLDALAALAEARGETDLAGAVADLGSKDLLVVDEGEWSFRSEVVREVAYETLTKAARARRHAGDGRLAVGALAASGAKTRSSSRSPTTTGWPPSSSASWAAIEGVPDDILGRALKAIERAAVRAHERDMHPVSVRLLDQAMRLLPPDSPHRERVLLARAKSRAGLHELAGAREDLAELLAIATSKNNVRIEAAALTVLGDVQQRSGRRHRVDRHSRTGGGAVERARRPGRQGRGVEQPRLHPPAERRRHRGRGTVQGGPRAGAGGR